MKKKGIPVPDEMEEMRKALIAEIDKQTMPVDELLKVYIRLLDLIIEFGKLCRRSPRKDLSIKAKEKRQGETDTEILKNILVTVLKETGGTGKEKIIIQRVGEELQSKLTEADVECPGGKTPRWQYNLKRARRELIKEGILAPESKGRIWTLVS